MQPLFPQGAPSRIGLDFDNTVVDYDRLFFLLARERGLVGPDMAPSKTAVRDAVRLLPDGETLWRRLQAAAYGERIGEASLFPGAREFLVEARRRGSEVLIVSHKTRFAAEGRADLREAALRFLREADLLAPAEAGLKLDRVFFEDTRRDKAARVASLGVELFVDDLPEVFAEPEFPREPVRALFAPGGAAGAELPSGVMVVESYDELSRLVFAARPEAR